MEKLFIIVVVLYALFVSICLLRIRLSRKRKKDIVGKSSSKQAQEQSRSDIVGKSSFILKQSKPLQANAKPLASDSPKSENREENPDTFVPPNKEKPSAEVPQEELDEVFSETHSDENNEAMEIDFPLEYEEDYSEEEEEVEGMAQASLASGVRFEELGNVVRTVNQTDKATSEQKKQAGNTLLEIRQTDMFEQLVSAKPDAKRIVTELMAESLSAFYERKDKETSPIVNSKQVPDDFDIRDFV